MDQLSTTDGRQPPNPAVITVLGPRSPRPGGVVDAHAHLWISPPDGVRAPDAPVLNDEPAIVAELTELRAEGGSGAIDCQPPGAGRDPEKLAAISRATGLEIVASTGFHLERYYPPDAWTWTASPEELADRFAAELTLGMESPDGRRTAHPAGVIKTAHPGALTDPRYVRLFAAACEASRRTGAAILVHTEQGRGVEGLVEFFLREGISPTRVVLCHVDKRPDPALHRELAAAGFLLEFDTFLRPKYEPETRVWPLLEGLLQEGVSGAVACALDLADAAQWRFRSGGPGMLGLIRIVRPRLERLGVAPEEIPALLGGNIYGRIARPAG